MAAAMTYLIGSAILGSLLKGTAFGLKELGLKEKELDLRTAMMESERKGTKRAHKTQVKQTKESVKELKALRREERAETQEDRAMQMLMQGKEHETAMIMGLIQAMTQSGQRRQPRTTEPPSSFVSLLR